MFSPNIVKILTLISGVLAIVLANLSVFNLPIAVQAVLTGVGGIILSIFTFLEHPTTQAVANSVVVKNDTAK